MKKILVGLFFLVYTFSIHAQNDFTISSLFGKNMVLQSEKEFRIYGKGTQGDIIKIELITNGKTIYRKAKVNNKGEWFADFPALPAKMECNFAFSNKSKVIEIKQVKTGDIWLIIGGSNTVHLLGNADLFEEERIKQDSMQFQYMIIPKGSNLMPQSLPENAEWKNHNNINLPNIPSIAYYLGTSLSANLDLPLGIINCGYGGSLVESWMSASDLGYTDESMADQNKLEKQEHTKLSIKDFENKFSYEVKIDSLDGDPSLFASQEFDDSKWKETKVPETFDKKGLDNFDGVVWFRRIITVPEGIKIDKISIGYVDDSDEVYINGQFVGGIEDGYGIPRIYTIPDMLMKPGKNTIAVRVRDIGGGGGMYGNPELYTISGGGLTINIAGNWKFRVEAVETDVPMNDIRRAAMLYNQMINPLTTFPIKGIVWYQGEVEAENLSDFTTYEDNLKNLIKGYRRNFKHEELPFIIVQLPSFGDNTSRDLSSWVNFKYVQDKVAAEMPNTEIISITDLINEKNNFDIHLSNHKATGERIAKTVQTAIYNTIQGGLCPRILDYEVTESSLVLSFENANKLIANDDYGYIKGFELAGPDRKFFKVQARVINNNKVLLNSTGIRPVYLKYCGNVNAVEGNLYNEQSMPVIPFTIKLKE